MTHGREHLITRHDKIRVPLLHARCSNTNNSNSFKESPPPESAGEYFWFIKSSTLIECPLLVTKFNFLGKTVLQEYRYNFGNAPLSFTKHTKQLTSIIEEENIVVDFLECPMLSGTIKRAVPMLHRHYHTYTIPRFHAQISSLGESLLSDFEYELTFELKTSMVMTSGIIGCNSTSIAEPQIEYFLNPSEVSNHIQTKRKKLETDGLVVSSAFLRHYHLVTLIPREVDLIERTTSDGCLVWTTNEVIQIVRAGENIADHSTITFMKRTQPKSRIRSQGTIREDPFLCQRDLFIIVVVHCIRSIYSVR